MSDIKKKKYGIKEAWLLNEDGEKIMNLGNGFRFGDEIDLSNITDEERNKIINMK